MKALRTALAMKPRVRPALLSAAAILAAASIFLPLWKMILVSIQYPEGLRMIVYPTRIIGDIRELNLLNHYIGMREISDHLFTELRVLPLLFALIALLSLLAAFIRRWWATLPTLAVMAGTSLYGLLSMQSRLYQYGHDLDATAPIDIEPFTPPMLGQHQIAQFATSAFFSWGTYLPMIAGLLVALVLWLDLERRKISRA